MTIPRRTNGFAMIKDLYYMYKDHNFKDDSDSTERDTTRFRPNER